MRRRTCTTGCWGPVIFAIEFKVGKSAYRRADIPIIPILVATEAA